MGLVVISRHPFWIIIILIATAEIDASGVRDGRI
jgi:hypothetical protein